MAAITLFVFFTLRDFGPASAVRRFHEDVASQNWNDLQHVCTELVTSPRVARLGDILRTIDDSGASARLAGMERSSQEVDVLVLYREHGREFDFVWVVQKGEIGWQVDPTQTLLANPGL